MPALDTLEGAAVALDERSEVEPVWRAEQLLEPVGYGGRLRQKREDAAAVVVEQHDQQIQLMLARGQQPVQIVIEGDVADHQHHAPDARRAGAERARYHAVDAVGAAVREASQRARRSRQERIQIPHRHAVARVQQRRLGEQRSQLGEDPAFEELVDVGEEIREDGHALLASETSALDNVGAEVVRELTPGELVVIDEEGVHARQAIPTAGGGALCIFELFYLARPDSRLAGVEVHGARVRMGERLANEAPVEADLVLPIPDSGTPAAIGFARASGIPFS